MKKIITLLLGTIISVNANAYNLSNKWYFGINLGLSKPFYASQKKDQFNKLGIDLNKSSVNAALVVGKNLGNWGLEFYVGAINAIVSKDAKDNEVTVGNALYSLDANMNVYTNQRLTLKTLAGLGLATEFYQLNAANGQTLTAKGDNKLGIKVGMLAQYAISDNFSLTTSFNYVKVINNDEFSGALYANAGINIHI